MPRNAIQSTTDYASFGFLHTNRDIVTPHVNRLKAAIEEHGNFTEISPVLVNQRMQVIDGQHRLEACRELGLPVYYRVHDGLSIDEARQMNVLSRNWTAADYMESYAKEGIQQYKDIQMLKEEFPNIASMAILITYAKGNQAKGYLATFRRGQLEEFNVEAARKNLQKLTDLQSVSDVFQPKAVALAALRMFRHPDYDHQRMLRKVAVHRGSLRPFQNVVDNLRQLEEVYNSGLSDTSRIRFF